MTNKEIVKQFVQAMEEGYIVSFGLYDRCRDEEEGERLVCENCPASEACLFMSDNAKNPDSFTIKYVEEIQDAFEEAWNDKVK